MPPVAAAVAAIATAITASTVIGKIIGVVIGIGLTALSSALTPKPDKPRLRQIRQEIIQTVRDPVRPREMVVGKIRKGGTIVFITTTNNQKDLHIAIAYAGHECEAMEEIYFNEDLAFDISGTVRPKFSGKAFITKHLGSSTQAADTDLVNDVPEWTSAHQLKGICYLRVKLLFDRDLFSAIPNVTAVIKGAKFLDTRDSNTKWTDNAALVLAGYLNDSTFGLGAPYNTEIDNTDLNAAANVCDELVTIPQFGTGAIQINVDATKGTFTRLSGSFIDDDFIIGQSFIASGFANAGSNVTKIIKLITATVITVTDTTGLVTETGSGDEELKSPATEKRYTANGVIISSDEPRRILEQLLTAMAGKLINSGRTLSATLETEVAKTTVRPAILVELETFNRPVSQTQFIRVWSGIGDLVFDGDTYKGVGEFGRISPVQESGEEIRANAINLELSGIPSSLISTALGNEYRGRPANIRLAFLDSAGAIVDQPIDLLPNKWSIKAGEFTTFVESFDEGDLWGNMQVQALMPKREIFNAVKGTFVSAKNNWQPADFPPLLSTTFLDQDNGEGIWSDIELPYTVSETMAERLAKIHLFVAREQISVIYPTSLKALKVKAGDTVQITNTRMGWTDKNFLVSNWSFVVREQDDVPLLGIDLQLREISSTVYDITAGEMDLINAAPGTDLPPPSTINDATISTTQRAGPTSEANPSGFEAIKEPEESTAWLGTKSGLVKNPWKGVLECDDQDLADANNQDVFDNFIGTPVLSPSYETPEISISFDDAVRTIAPFTVVAGPGETGSFKSSLFFDFKTAAGAFGGFQPLRVASVTGKTFKYRLEFDTSGGAGFILQKFKPIMAKKTVTEIKKNQTIDVGGRTFTFAQKYHNNPGISVTPLNNPRLPKVTNLDGTDFTLQLLDETLTDVGGNADYRAEGV